MYKVYAITDIGRERQQNQDGFFVDGSWCANTPHKEVYYETDSDYIHVAVCDGVGSTVFAANTVQFAMQYLASRHIDVCESSVEKLVIDLNAYVYDELRKHDMLDGACTISGLIIKDDNSYIYNIGDSPAFSVNNGYLEKQSTDDTSESLFGNIGGEIDTMQQRTKPPLLQSIGTNKLLDKVHIKHVSGEKAYIICSDGITDMLTIDEMEDILENSDSLQELAQTFVNSANDRGGFDNSTIVLLVKEEE